MIDRFGLMPVQLKNLIRITEIKIRANKLGIEKIEMHARGGRFTFNDQPDIDPMLIIKLIQTEANTYKLDGQNKLKITKTLNEPESRFLCAEQLLIKLSKGQ